MEHNSSLHIYALHFFHLSSSAFTDPPIVTRKLVTSQSINHLKHCSLSLEKTLFHNIYNKNFKFYFVISLRHYGVTREARGASLISARVEYKERQADYEKYRKVFVTAHVILRTAAMFLVRVLNRGRKY